MRVKLLTSMAGISFSHNQGDVIDCTEAEGKRFIEAGIAEPIRAAAPKPEKATKKFKAERATKRG